jgi:EAL domain-containing protein (putative c-di-GMP-specific phosphodiesterase class I)
MLCTMDPSPRPDLGEAHVATLSMLAALLGDLLERSADESELHRAVRRRLESALHEDGLRIALQPIVATADGHLVGAEALARFPGGGPAGWFADAESVGLRSELEYAAATRALDRLPELAEDVLLTVNMSPDLVVDGVLDRLLADVDATRVVLEVTEHAAIPDYPDLHRALRPHRAAGLQLAVDDAGAGYASFRHILNLRPDLIKVDISLVQGIDTDPGQQALVESLLVFADRSDATLLAEGVERPEELDLLTTLGVPLVQGYLVGRPSLSNPCGRRLLDSPSRTRAATYREPVRRRARPPAAAG